MAEESAGVQTCQYCLFFLPFQTWDEALAKSAKAWSKKCTFKHNSHLNKNGVVHPTFYPVGENLYATTGSFNTKEAIKAWNSEVTNYDFDTNTCKKYSVCGHYTQVIFLFLVNPVNFELPNEEKFTKYIKQKMSQILSSICKEN